MVKQLQILFTLLGCAGVTLADQDRDRRVRVALALTASEHAVALPNYSEGHRMALERGEPLVVFVGCNGRHHIEPIPGVVTAAVRELSGYESGSVVVSYPHGGKLMVFTTLRCSDHGEPVVKAAGEARKKIAMPPERQRAAPVPLNWDVRTVPCANSGCPLGACPLR